MSVGRISSATLVAIANAIRAQNGTTATYTAAEMAGAVSALDGTKAGVGMVAEASGAAEGLLSSARLSALADAIRAQNGLSTLYLPSEMPAAILALSWDVGLKPRAVLCADGTLELNFLEKRACNSSSAGILSAWEVKLDGYASQGERPWDSTKLAVKRVVFDDSWASAGCQSCKEWFVGCANLLEVTGFEHVAAAGTANLSRMFLSCSSLESVYARGFDAGAVTEAALVFQNCSRLVGGAGFVSASSSGASSLSFGEKGSLTDPRDDGRAWAWAHVYADKELVIGGGPSGDGREVLLSGRVCLNARYAGLAGLAWNGLRHEILRVSVLDGAAAGADAVSMDWWFRTLDACTAFSGLGNLGRVSSMVYAFYGCKAVASLDLRGVDPSGLGNVAYAFCDCEALTTITVDATWATPDSCAGGGTFSGCTSLVGGAGSRLADTPYLAAGDRMRIDKGADGIGYLTAG